MTGASCYDIVLQYCPTYLYRLTSMPSNWFWHTVTSGLKGPSLSLYIDSRIILMLKHSLSSAQKKASNRSLRYCTMFPMPSCFSLLPTVVLFPQMLLNLRFPNLLITTRKPTKKRLIEGATLAKANCLTTWYLPLLHTDYQPRPSMILMIIIRSLLCYPAESTWTKGSKIWAMEMRTRKRYLSCPFLFFSLRIALFFFTNLHIFNRTYGFWFLRP